MAGKIDGQYWDIFYYFGEYHAGVTRVYHTVLWAVDEEAARVEFYRENKGAAIKYIR